MTAMKTVARPYAEAVFSQAQRDQQFDIWQQVLNWLKDIVLHDDVATLIANPVTEETQLVWLIEGILADLSAQSQLLLPKQMQAYISLLVEEKRMDCSPEIARLFIQLYAKERNILQAKVNSALPLTEVQQDNLQSAIQQHFSATVEMNYHIDPELIGGMSVRIGNAVYDSTIVSKLMALKASLQTDTIV